MEWEGDGGGVFEAVKVVNGEPFALQRHLDRLLGSARSLRLPRVREAEVRDVVEQALAGAVPPLARIRITLSRRDGLDGVAEVTATVAPMARASEATSVVTSPWPRNEGGALVGHKTLAYVGEVVALAHARAAGASEALLANTAGHLCEGTTSNVFYVVDGELRTPSLATGCLPGVTRALVLEWFGAREVAEPIEVARAASEVFLASTTRDVQPVTRWDDRELAPGPVTSDVQREWRRQVSSEATSSSRS